jgi:hypothetical protein
LPYDPAIPLLGIYPKECNSGYSGGTCTSMFIAALFTIAKLWKQLRCPTTDEWIKKMWFSLWKKIWRLLKNLNIDLLFDTAIPLLGIYPKECNTGYFRGTCTPMFFAALFTIANLWKQPRCSTIDEWIKKMWYLYTMEFYSAMKKNEISLGGKWMELENIIVSKVSQAQKTKNLMFSLICRL